MNKKHPPHKILRIILTTIGLAISGVIFGVLGGFLAGRGLGDGSLADLGLAIIGLLLGYAFGIIIGLFGIRFILHQRGSVFLGIVAAVVWVGVSIAIAIPFNLSDNFVSIVVALFLLCVPVAAMLGFNLRR